MIAACGTGAVGTGIVGSLCALQVTGVILLIWGVIVPAEV
jgi:hypothetical protein